MRTYSPYRLNHDYFYESMTICNNIKHLKELSGLSYRKLSLALGFKEKSLLNYCCTYTRPNSERLEKIVSYFGIENVEDLCMKEDEFKLKYPKMK